VFEHEWLYLTLTCKDFDSHLRVNAKFKEDPKFKGSIGADGEDVRRSQHLMEGELTFKNLALEEGTMTEK